MSEFIEALMLTDVHKSHAQKFRPNLSFTISEFPDARSPISFMREYRMEVTYCKTIRCYEEHKDTVLKLGKEEIARELYRGLRDELGDMQIAIYAEDRDGMIASMTKLLDIIQIT